MSEGATNYRRYIPPHARNSQQQQQTTRAAAQSTSTQQLSLSKRLATNDNNNNLENATDTDDSYPLHWLENTAIMNNMGDISNVRIVNFDDAIKKAESLLSHPSMVAVAVMSQKRMYMKHNGPELSKDARPEPSIQGCYTIWRSPALKDLTESANLYQSIGGRPGYSSNISGSRSGDRHQNNSSPRANHNFSET